MISCNKLVNFKKKMKNKWYIIAHNINDINKYWNLLNKYFKKIIFYFIFIIIS